jgi:hypothetical protein
MLKEKNKLAFGVSSESIEVDGVASVFLIPQQS